MFNWANWPPQFTYSQKPRFAQDFPGLRPHLCVGEVSDATGDYNCIGWATGDNANWWEPDPLGLYHWPAGVQRVYSRQAYIEAFRTAGFELCDDPLREDGQEKIAIYTTRGDPEHAARQLRNGNWTSKLGGYEDIEHINLDCLNGPLYGHHTTYMKRGRQ